MTLKGYEVAHAIAGHFDDALFCFFRTYTDKKGKLVKQPLQRDGTLGVRADTPPERLVTAQEVLELSVQTHGEYWGVVMHNPTEDIVGNRLTILDMDGKNKPSDVPEAQDMADLRDLAVRSSWLTERSHSGKGHHIIIATPEDATLPRKVVLGVGQEVEVFGYPGSDGKCVMLTGTEMSGELVIVQSVKAVLPMPVSGATEDLKTPPSPSAAHTEPPAPNATGPLSECRIINDLALAHLDFWVPQLWPDAENKGRSGWRVPSEALGRSNEEDLSFHRDGIKDWGVWDMGDARQGKRTPIDVVAQWITNGDWKAAADILRHLLGMSAYRVSAANASADFAKLDSRSSTHPLAQFVDLANQPRPPRWVIPGFIGQGVVTIAGAHGVGKTTAILPLAMVVAGLHRHSDPLAPLHWRHVVYIVEDVEQAQRILAGIAGWCSLIFSMEEIKARLHIVEARRLDPQVVAQVGKTYREQFTRIVDGVEVLPLVVVDTKAAVLELDNENDNSEASRAMAALKQGFDGLPIWLVGHVAKTNIGRADVASLSLRGGSAFEADANQTLFLVKESDGSRWLVRGKTRFEAKWSELHIEPHTETVTVTDEFGQLESVTLRWGVAQPPQANRKELKEQAKVEADNAEMAELRDDIRDTVQTAWNLGHPLNKAGIRSKVRKKGKLVADTIELLLTENWLYEVSVPSKLRTHPRRSCFIVNLNTEQHEAFMADGVIPDELLVIPQSWRKPESEPEQDQEQGCQPAFSIVPDETSLAIECEAP